jgi:radical SAM superfamily enzyme YgiQ (UPF0313 family)
VRVVLISTYELGRQPFGLASPAAWLREAGMRVRTVDLSREPLDVNAVREAGFVAFHLPMHTATRLALPVVDEVRALAPSAVLCAYGLYAPVNARLLRARGVAFVLGGEFEEDLVEVARAVAERRVPAPGGPGLPSGRAVVPRLAFRVPARDGLPAPDRYAALRRGDGQRTVTGYTEASRGCKHLCRHCPVVPVYGGRFRIVPVGIVLADVRQQVAAGARHVTFGDPDFLNGIGHARAVVAGLAREFPGVTYDVTIKVEHLVRYEAELAGLRETGCVLVTSAVESIDDEVLRTLAKGHTRSDAERAIAACRAAGLPLAPTFVAFTPWTTREGYRELLEWIAAQDLVDDVAPIQLALRLLIPAASRLLDLDDVRRRTGPFDDRALAHPWQHEDPAMDRLQRDVGRLVAASARDPRARVFDRIWSLAEGHLAGGGPLRRPGVSPAVRRRTEVVYLDEPWYC